MELKVFQKGFNYSQDGRGNRLIWHLQGCNMSCPWCSNPEGMPPQGVLMTDREWLRESCCPRGAVKDGGLDRSVCSACPDRQCTRRRQKGIRLSCKSMDVREVADICVSSKSMFFDGGGVTLTGGEISLQFEAVRELLTLLGENGIHRAIESNGSHPRMAELIPLVDEWIMDVKHYDSAVHRKWTGVSNENTIRTLEAVTQRHGDVLIRTPIIPGFNDSDADAEGFVRLFKEHVRGENVRFEFLSYHEFGKAKWEQCGMMYTMPEVRLAEGRAAYFEEKMRGAGFTCVRT